MMDWINRNEVRAKRYSKYSIIIIPIILLILLCLPLLNAATPQTTGNRYETEKSSTSGQRSMNWLRLVYGASSQYGTGVSSLLMSKEDVDKRRLEAERKLAGIFGATGGNIPGTVESYVYLMCKAHIPTTGNGLAVIDTKDGGNLLAYVAGKRITYQRFNTTANGSIVSNDSYIYKISFKVINKDTKNETLSFNVYIDNVKLFNNSIKLEDGKEYSKTADKMIIKMSSNRYTNICIRFDDRPLYVNLPSGREDLTNLCNRITDGGSETGTAYVPQGYGLGLDNNDGATDQGNGGSSSSSSGGGNGQNQLPNEI